MPLPSYFSEPMNPFRSVMGPTWEGGPPKERIRHLPAGGDLLGLHVNSNPGLAALHNNLATLAGMPRQHALYETGSTTAPMSGGGYSGGGHSHSPEFSMPGTGPSTIHGYTGGGIPTDIFSQLTGRAPTADDYYRLHNPQSLQQQVAPTGLGITPPSSVTAPALAANKNTDTEGLPLSPMGDILGGPVPGMLAAASGGDIPKDHPVLVGEEGPEVVVPKKDATVIPNHYLPMMYLMKGDIPNYLKSLR